MLLPFANPLRAAKLRADSEQPCSCHLPTHSEQPCLESAQSNRNIMRYRMMHRAISCDITRYRTMYRAISCDIARCIVRYRHPSHTHLGLRRRQLSADLVLLSKLGPFSVANVLIITYLDTAVWCSSCNVISLRRTLILELLIHFKVDILLLC